MQMRVTHVGSTIGVDRLRWCERFSYRDWTWTSITVIFAYTFSLRRPDAPNAKSVSTGQCFVFNVSLLVACLSIHIRDTFWSLYLFITVWAGHWIMELNKGREKSRSVAVIDVAFGIKFFNWIQFDAIGDNWPTNLINCRIVSFSTDVECLCEILHD